MPTVSISGKFLLWNINGELIQVVPQLPEYLHPTYLLQRVQATNEWKRTQKKCNFVGKSNPCARWKTKEIQCNKVPTLWHALTFLNCSHFGFVWTIHYYVNHVIKILALKQYFLTVEVSSQVRLKRQTRFTSNFLGKTMHWRVKWNIYINLTWALFFFFFLREIKSYYYYNSLLMTTLTETDGYKSTHIFGFCIKLPRQELVIWYEACCSYPPGFWRNLWLWC